MLMLHAVIQTWIKDCQQINWEPPIHEQNTLLPYCCFFTLTLLYTIHKLLHEVAQRCLLPGPAFSIEVVPLHKLIHVCRIR
jgi:hypothetical protein